MADSDWEDIAIGPPLSGSDGDWEDIAIGPPLKAQPSPRLSLDYGADNTTLGGLGMGASQGFLRGLGKTAALPVDLLQWGGNKIVSALGGTPVEKYPSEVIDDAIVGLAGGYDSRNANTGLERAADTIGDFAGGAATFGVGGAGLARSASPTLAKVGGVIAASPGAQLVGALGGGTGASVAREQFPDSMAAQIVAPLVGGALSEAGVGALKALGPMGKASARRALGARYGDYAKTANEAGIMDLPDGSVNTATKKALDELIDEGSLGKSRNPEKLLVASDAASDVLEKQIGQVVADFDRTRTAPVFPTFDNAMQFLASGKVPADKVGDYLKRLAKLNEGIRNEGKGALSYIQQQKVAFGKLWNANDIPLSEFNRAIYGDLKTTVEQAVPGITALNQNLQRFKIADPILRRGLAQAEAGNVPAFAKSLMWTTGGISGPGVVGTLAGGPVGTLIGLGAGAALTAGASRKGQQVLSNAMRGAGSVGQALSGGLGNSAANQLAQQFAGQERPKKQAPQSPQPQARDTAGPQSPSVQASASSVPSAPQVLSAQRVALNRSPAINYRPDLPPTQAIAAVKPLVEAQHPLVRALIHVESRGNPQAKSPKGAKGLMQLMPLIERKYKVDASDPEQNVKGGTAFLGYLLKTYGKEHGLETSLAAYNAGETKVNAAIKKVKAAGLKPTWENIRRYLPAETRAYPGKVAAELQKYVRA